jgi:hypothetical protein
LPVPALPLRARASRSLGARRVGELSSASPGPLWNSDRAVLGHLLGRETARRSDPAGQAKPHRVVTRN